MLCDCTLCVKNTCVYCVCECVELCVVKREREKKRERDGFVRCEEDTSRYEMVTSRVYVCMYVCECTRFECL